MTDAHEDEDVEAVRDITNEGSNAPAGLRRFDSAASDLSSSSSSSSGSSTFSARDPDWYLDVTLGFVQLAATAAAFRHLNFPSKFGGRPVWLYGPHRGPPPQTCSLCSSQLVFLLQVYAPVDSTAGAFHRTLYVFVCRARGCRGGRGAARVLVAQLPRDNALYPFSVDDGAKPALLASGAPRHACALCGCSASSRCGKCSLVWYCSRDCQRQDWRLGHKLECGPSCGPGSAALERKRLKWLFKELEVVNEPCPTPPDARSDASSSGSDSDCDAPARKVGASAGPGAGVSAGAAAKALSVHVDNGQASDAGADVSQRELPKSLFREARRGRSKREDVAFRRFSDAMRSAPAQVLRYWREGRPLWPARAGRPDELPKCKRCGGDVAFEMQVLPQALYYLGVDSTGGGKALKGEDAAGGLDWGTIAVFTCVAACGAGMEYIEETAWVQKIPQS